ncbi:MAG: hypothetical protein HXY41_14365 [Chloroflexi bacterium]|nr:hypothetical protein [Chloroflexota bacterium]
MSDLAIVETILRSRTFFFGEIRGAVLLGNKISSMLLSCFTFLAIYGAVMGASHSPLQVVASALKLPALFLVTLLICTPSLHYFNILFGSKQTMGQTVALILTAMTTTSVILVSFAPITLFFLLTTANYPFFKLLNVIFFAIAGGMGVVFLTQGFQIISESDNLEGVQMRRNIFIIWVLLYGFVGSQMAWTLSPFIGEPGHEFILFTQFGGSFYADVLASISQLLSGG